VYGIPASLDLSFLTNKELIQVAVGQFRVRFHFMENIDINVESTFVYQSVDALTIWRPNEIAAAAAPLKLLGRSVARVRTDPMTLWLHFDNGDKLAIIDDRHECESFTVTRPGQTIVV
jgi:hypothetical protein